MPLAGQQVVQHFVEDVAALREAGIPIVLPADEDLVDLDTLIQAPVLSLWGAEFPASYRVGMSNGSYGEGERVLGPPQGGSWAGMATAGMEEALLS